MAEFAIPFPYREGLTKLATLPDEDAATLVAAVAALEPFAPMSSIERAVTSAVGEGATPGEKRLALPLLALRGQMRELKPAQIAQRLSNSTDLELDDIARARLCERATGLLGTEVLGTTGVASDLQTLHDRNFQSARIVTDMRPVFRDELAESPRGAVIVESLQIQTWNRDGESELVFIAMDEADLRSLQKVVTRAIEKTDTLKTLIAEMGLAYFELEKEAADG